jgi:tRNA (adenine57-N1/adenine58-N1)-methyltransferase
MKEKGSVKRVAYSEGRFYSIRSVENDFHTQNGFIKKDELMNDVAVSNKGVSFRLFEPSFFDSISDLTRGPQIPFPKDVGIVIAKTGIGKSSIVVDSGAGSGYMSCTYANIVKKVYSFDIKDEHLEIAKKNAENAGLKNVVFKKLDIYTDKITGVKCDLVSLDVPEPWRAIDNVKKILKTGGFLSVYVPCITQINEFVDALRLPENKDDFHYIETIELNEKLWIVEGKRVRPENQQVTHTGFIAFARRI